MTPRGWLVAALALALAAAAVAGLIRSLGGSQRDVARIVWIDASGGELAGLGGCDNGDRDFATLVHEGLVWTSCGGLGGSSSLPGGAYAAVDPRSAEGLVGWPLPDELGLTFTRALAPGEDGLLGIVYMAGGMGKGNAKLVAAIAGPEGWVREPVAIFESASSVLPPVLLGVGWADHALEIALGGAWSSENERWRMVTLALASEPAVRDLTEARFCAGADTCRALAAYRSDHWEVLVERRLDDEFAIEWVPDLPGGAARELPSEAPGDLMERTGFAAAGLLADHAFGLERELTPSLELDEVRSPPADWERAARWKGHYEAREGRLRRVERWLIPDTGEAAVAIEDGFLIWRCDDRESERRLVVERRSGERSSVTVGPTMTREGCAGLGDAALILDGVSGEGALIDVGGRLVRFAP